MIWLDNLAYLLMDSNADHPGAGYCANAVFIVDNSNRIRYHEVMDVKMMQCASVS